MKTARFFYSRVARVPGDEPEEPKTDADDRQPPKREAEAGPQAARAQAARARGPVRDRGRGPGRGRAGGRRRAALPAHRRGLGAGRRGGRARPARRALLARLGDAGDRGLAAGLAPSAPMPPASTSTGSATPATSARSCAAPTRCWTAPSRSAPAVPIRTRRRRCGRAWARSSRARRHGPSWRRRRRRGQPWSPMAAPVWRRSTAPAPSAWAPSARGCRPRLLAECEAQVTIPLRPGGAESLNVAAAAAIAAQRLSSAAMAEASDA